MHLISVCISFIIVCLLIYENDAILSVKFNTIRIKILLRKEKSNCYKNFTEQALQYLDFTLLKDIT